MKNNLFQTFALLLLASISFFACQKDALQEPAPTKQTATEQYFAPLDIEGVTDRSACPWAVIPAGSVDALAQAINDICEDGIIYLRAGMHTENVPITITKPVKIIGEEGAVLKIKSDISPGDPATATVTLNPALHVLNAPGTLVQDLEIQPLDSDGGTAILAENSSASAVMRCEINNFQFAVVVEKSDRTTIMFNTIVATGLWLTGDVTDAESITIINGKSTYISDNEISNAVFGIWACDEWGTCERNNTHGNLIGLILCNVPQYLVLPSGEVTGSLIPAKGWKVRNNNSTGNFSLGYLVIDGANNNLLENNNASGNADYDMELTTGSMRFGFFTPESYQNTVITGAYPDITIKDCGRDNHISGGVLIDTVADPCN
ncbi:MAG TPA: hypothetical protein ENJ95_21370 [Bacteroidetes bacterium]|nr:hypothetical protein [Bacteroidota bacterium]